MSERSKAMRCKRTFILTVRAVVAAFVVTLFVVMFLHRERAAQSPDGLEGNGVDDARTESNSLAGVVSHVYEASASFRVGTREMLMRESPECGPMRGIVEDMIPGWRTPELVQKALQEYKRNYSCEADWVLRKDDEMAVILSNASFKTGRPLDQVTVFIRAEEPRLATGLAKAYVSAIATHTEEENRNRVKRHLEMCRDQEEFLRNEHDRLTDELARYPEGYPEEGRNRLMQELKIADGLRQGISNSISDVESNDRKNWWMISPGAVTEARKIE